MMQRTLGKLTKLDLRQVWLNEASSFTPWLAEPQNLAILGEELGIELELEAQEEAVGPFRADILCKDVDTDAWVLIENQLERTDHLHLGQLLTYSAGLQAAVVVWIAAKFTEEHRAALDHLNEITDEKYSFFGVEVELWQIGDSQPAPRFNLVSKPNDWSRAIGKAARRLDDEPISELKAQQKRYWEAFRERLKNAASKLRPRKPRPQHWTTLGIGRAGIHLAAKVNTTEKLIGAELYFGDENAKSYFQKLEAEKSNIEAEFGAALSWEPLPDRKGARIAVYKTDVDPTDETDWAAQHEWLVTSLNNLDGVFRARVSNLDAGEALEEGDL
jgi:hypothetical protein